MLPEYTLKYLEKMFSYFLALFYWLFLMWVLLSDFRLSIRTERNRFSSDIFLFFFDPEDIHTDTWIYIFILFISNWIKPDGIIFWKRRIGEVRIYSHWRRWPEKGLPLNKRHSEIGERQTECHSFGQTDLQGLPILSLFFFFCCSVIRYLDVNNFLEWRSRGRTFPYRKKIVIYLFKREIQRFPIESLLFLWMSLPYIDIYIFIFLIYTYLELSSWSQY